jgi:argininosuccinate lyase
MVVAGMPFRDAYKAVAEQLENGTFNLQETKHTHEGSIKPLFGCQKKKKWTILINSKPQNIPLKKTTINEWIFFNISNLIF